MIRKFFLLGCLVFFSGLMDAVAAEQSAVTASISPAEIQGFDSFKPPVKKLLLAALALTQRHITYRFASADPVQGGMDCSGTVYYLLRQAQVADVPRQSDKQFEWAKRAGKFYTVSATMLSSSEFDHLQPGDLLFWEGTYVVKRSSSVSHVMFYLGKNMQGEPLMVGASDGRTYLGKKMWGVSVFDFRLPKAGARSRFVGYGCVPRYSC